MWEVVDERRHTVSEVYVVSNSCKDVVVSGEAKTTFKNGTIDLTPFLAKLVLEDDTTGLLRVSLMQVYIVSGSF